MSELDEQTLALKAARARPLTALQPRPSTIIPFLRRLTFIVSLLLGSAAATSWIWSTFLLPLLHATFSARNALVEQQSEKVTQLLESIKEIRSRQIWRKPDAEEALDDESFSSSTSLHSHPASTPLPLESLTTLSTQLRSLASAVDSTSTTRTSLLSTLEMFTSQLHDTTLRSVHSSSFSTDSPRSEEWKAVRNEIRGMKGILLGRRNFAQVV
ncbi:hypothetical protein BD324DRAFT_647655 [Kockovaella imperatae]|uniref:Peroxin-14 n=1 Tax=Kockovaella imperatae TaxID=4999 RepID=A0A1Y1URR0_9TREE|nr:hypothetical protein BD324DRAFT_647655 [Kockovaella imperatae]ORX40741.1 hypothetical protein BD324DRAFT_647655 [Kockovaella imperatae]